MPSHEAPLTRHEAPLPRHETPAGAHGSPDADLAAILPEITGLLGAPEVLETSKKYEV